MMMMLMMMRGKSERRREQESCLSSHDQLCIRSSVLHHPDVLLPNYYSSTPLSLSLLLFRN